MSTSVLPCREHTVAKRQGRRIGDDGAQSVALEQMLEQQEFRIQILALRGDIYDGDAAQGAIVSAQLPLIGKHRDDAFFQRIGCRRRGNHAFDLGAARALCARKHGIEHRTARVGVDLDQSEVAFGGVEVVAKEDAPGPTGIVAGNGRRVGEHFFTVSRQRNDRFDGTNHLRHALHLGTGHEHRSRREQGRAACLNQVGQARLAQFRFKRSAQRIAIEADTEALAVQRFDHRPGKLSDPGE